MQWVTQGSTSFSPSSCIKEGCIRGLRVFIALSASLSSPSSSLHSTPLFAHPVYLHFPTLTPRTLTSPTPYFQQRHRIMTEEKDSAYEAHTIHTQTTQTPSSSQKSTTNATSTSHINEKDPGIHPNHTQVSPSSSSSSTTVEAASPTADLEVSGGGDGSEQGSKPTVLLAPPDGGYGWVVVGACFLHNFSMLGIMFSWGIFQQHYTNNVFPGQVSAVSWIGTLAFGCMYIIGGFFSMFAARIGYRKMIFAGSIFVAGGCIAASFATQVMYPIHMSNSLFFSFWVRSGRVVCVCECVTIAPGWLFDFESV